MGCAGVDARPTGERTGGRLTSRQTRGVLLVVAAVCVLAAQLMWQHPWSPRPPYVDLQVYRAATSALFAGHDPYAALPGLQLLFTYPPFALIAFLPMLALGGTLLDAAQFAVSFVAFVVAVRCSLILNGERPGTRLASLTLAASALLLPLVPVVNTLRLGQVDLVLLAAVLVDLSGGLRRLPRGLLIGLAAGLKLLPGVFVVYLVITGRRRAAGVAAATALCTMLAGFAVAPADSWAYWTRLLYDEGRVGRPEMVLNQSLKGAVLAIPAGSALWLVAALATAVLGTLCAARLYRLDYRLLSLGVYATATLLAAPISWVHYWVWAAPVAIALLSMAWRNRHRTWRLPLVLATVGWLLAFASWPYRLAAAAWLPAPLTGWTGQLYVIAGLTLIAAAAVSVLRPSRRPSLSPAVSIDDAFGRV